MPSIKLAKNIGFCSGVRRAVNIVEETLAKSNAPFAHSGGVYSFGPVIHNPEVIRQLEQKNLRSVNSLTKVKPPATVILPSHGFPRHILNIAKKKKLSLIDVTCPYVSSVQKICRQLFQQGFKVIIIGDKKHPEIKALKDLAKGAHIIQNLKDIKENMFSSKRIGIISQTTQAKDVFLKFVTCIIRKNSQVKEVRIFNTICLDTVKRQEETKKLAKKVDALLVIGSHTSANTKRLFSIGRNLNKKTYLVETEDAPLSKLFRRTDNIGLISGASTPDWLVNRIMKKIKLDTDRHG